VKKAFIYMVIGLSFFCILFLSCSKKEEEVKKEKGAIEKMTDQVAVDALDKINDPLNKARAVQDVHDQRVEQIEDTMEE
jgi:hypothetical protein